MCTVMVRNPELEEEAEAVAGGRGTEPADTWARRTRRRAGAFGRFVGPGFMVSVAYIDPGNYATDVAAGASQRFALLFVVLASNLAAILLQSLAARLGTVTGLDLAAMCRARLPRWLNLSLYVLAEVAIVATDLAEVMGTAVALNLLFPGLPLVAGCAIAVVDVMAVLVFYRPQGAMRGLRTFEALVSLLVIGVVVCFALQLYMLRGRSSVGDVFRGYLPSSVLVQPQALYQACGILGATVMPHGLYLGSGIVQPRLREYDAANGLLPRGPEPEADDGDGVKTAYVPSLTAVRHALVYTVAELALLLCTLALFVNSAILIVAGISLYGTSGAANADLFGIHDLLSRVVSPVAGTIFALALLLSGVSAGIVCTIAGQMVCEGALNWRVRPWLRRLITRSISVVPALLIAAAVGRRGLATALNASQVVLSVVLPFISLPLIYFTSRSRFMTVEPGAARYVRDVDDRVRGGDAGVDLSNSWCIIVISVIAWLVIAVMNVANVVLLAMGKS
ncbi:transporter protein smf2 [Ophiocordyceps camponoti-floridani]|uniref:Transporter protein smf2 n=1 Tax=Ophiocordyceps camponoti-floridani TaxID=2030778 RepID=A0A8H4QBA3_9HYPO|nr:transporter protein smf2 [Ophiocordyceps camponoti-floridani]